MENQNYLPRIIDQKISEYLQIFGAVCVEDPKGKAPTALCVICGLANAAYQRKDGVFVVPITALKN